MIASIILFFVSVFLGALLQKSSKLIDRQRIQLRVLHEKNRLANNALYETRTENRNLRKHLELPPHKRPVLELPEPKKEEKPLKLPDLTGVPGPVALFIGAAIAAMANRTRRSRR